MTSLQFSHLDKTIEWTKLKLLMNQFWHLDSPDAASSIVNLHFRSYLKY